MYKILYVLSILFFISCTKSNDEQSVGVSFINVQNGDTLTSPFLLQMGVEGMTLEPKGEPNPGHGHHHLIVNGGPIDAGLIIIADDNNIHYGGGQSEDSVFLIQVHMTLLYNLPMACMFPMEKNGQSRFR